MTRVAFVVVIFAFLATAAGADILEWDDAAGVRHYTNLKSEVPSQQAVQVVVDEQVWLPQGPALPVVEEQPVAPTELPRDAADDLRRAYLAGLESGLASEVSSGAGVYLDTPLAVTVSSPPYPGGYVLPGYDWLLPAYYPFVTTSLVGRHRQQIQGERFGATFHQRDLFPKRFTTPAGPPPLGAAGPPPLGAAGPPPLGAAGPPPLGAAGPPPLGMTFRR